MILNMILDDIEIILVDMYTVVVSVCMICLCVK